VFRKYRDEYFENAVSIIYGILNRYRDNSIEEEDFGDLSERIYDMVTELENARFFGRMSVGGNNISPPSSIDHRERAWVDQIETTYSLARSIRRFLRHDLQLVEYSEMSDDINGDLSDYIGIIHQKDVDFILNNLHKITERIEVFSGILEPIINEIQEN